MKLNANSIVGLPAVIEVIRLAKIVKARRGLFLLACGTMFLTGILEAALMSSLLPFIQSFLKMDFAPLRESWLFTASAFVLPNVMNTIGSQTAFVVFAGMIAGLIVIKNSVGYSSTLIMAVYSESFITKLKVALLRRFLGFGMLYFDRSRAGYNHTILTNYTESFAYNFGQLQAILLYTVMSAVYMALLVNISWKLTLLVTTIFPFLFLLTSYLIKRLEKTASERVEWISKFSSKAGDILHAIPLIQIACKENAEANSFEKICTTHQSYNISIARRRGIFEPAQEAISLLGALFLTGVFAIFIAQKNDPTLSATQFIVFFVVLRRLISGVSAVNSARGNFAAAIGPIMEIRDIFSDADKNFVLGGTTEFRGIKQQIEVRDLDFSYQAGQPILNKLTATIVAGKVTAIVGRTGSGKSTVVKLLSRLYDCPKGTIFVDGTDIKDFTVASYRKHVSMVTQETFLFNATIRENLVYALDEAVSDERIWEALEDASLVDTVRRLKDGLETVIGDRGIRLSGGEKQRLAIARAMLRNTDILILDEATSALDSNTEKDVQSAIEKLTKGRTSIIIAHRLSTIQKADHILVVEDGELVEQGPLNKLISKKGAFFNYWELQRLAQVA